MSQIIFDTNMILRWLLEDNAEMVKKVDEYLINYNVFVTLEVIAEVFYVLRKVYSLERNEIVTIVKRFIRLVNCSEMEVLQCSINTYNNYNLNFVDCILYSYNKIKHIEIATWDKKLKKLINGNTEG